MLFYFYLILNKKYINKDYDFGLSPEQIDVNEAKVWNQNENILFATNSEKGFYVLDISNL